MQVAVGLSWKPFCRSCALFLSFCDFLVGPHWVILVCGGSPPGEVWLVVDRNSFLNSELDSSLDSFRFFFGFGMLCLGLRGPFCVVSVSFRCVAQSAA